MPRFVPVGMKLKEMQGNELLFCSVTENKKEIILNSIEE
jgi:hypothetical protein